MTPEITSYNIKPTKLIPNSFKPLLLYKNCFTENGKVSASLAYDTFARNGWDAQWVTTYGHYQRSHYHPATHEAMVVLSGPGTIRWGVADLDDDPQKHTYGTAYEEGGVEVEVSPGDVFVIPAGVTHKSWSPAAPNPDPVCLTGGANHHIDAEDPRQMVAGLQVDGFTMMGAYPRGYDWGWSEGGDHAGRFEEVWGVENPKLDPVLGDKGGITQYWKPIKSSL